MTKREYLKKRRGVGKLKFKFLLLLLLSLFCFCCCHQVWGRIGTVYDKLVSGESSISNFQPDKLSHREFEMRQIKKEFVKSEIY